MSLILLMKVWFTKAYEENLTLQNGTVSKIKQLFCKIGFNHVWENQCSFSKKRLLVSVVKKLREKFINFWKLLSKCHLDCIIITTVDCGQFNSYIDVIYPDLDVNVLMMLTKWYITGFL